MDNRSELDRGLTMKNPHAVALGRLGGKVTGPCKARTSAQARAAVNARWARAKKKSEKSAK
jgi:hypothetical protein